MKMEECPKCGDSVEPKWHKDLLSVTLRERRSQHDKWNNCNEKEHLHYYCKCGYDFIKLIKAEKKGAGYDDMGRMVEDE